MDERLQSGARLEPRVSFVKDEELAPIPENSTLSKEATEVRATGEKEETESELSQPHVIALYEYFGRAVAEDFLHPRMDAAGGSGGGSVARTGADHHHMKRERTNQSMISNSTDVDSLWSTLRADSQARLTLRDARINERLKRAYNAFARQCLARREKPPERSFAPRDDLEELSRLMSTSQVEGVKEHRRRRELMFRQALVHENQYRILEHNNPLPDLTNRSGLDSINSYIPSWNTAPKFDDELLEEEEEEEREERPKKPSKPSLGELAFDSLVLQSSRRPPSYTTKRYRFLGDREYQPTFRTRIKEQFSSTNDPIESMLRQAQDRKDQAERGRRAGGGGEGPRAPAGFALRRRSAHIGPGGTAAAAAAAEEAAEVKRHVQRLGQSAPSSARAAAAAVVWEPLSLGALLDYKKSRSPTMTSHRPFRGGQVPWWSVDEARV